MTAGNVLLYLAVIGYVLYTKVQGRPVGDTKKLLVLPVILIVLGYSDVAHGRLGGVDISIAVIGAVMSFVLGAARGFTDKLSVRDGAAYVQWGVASLGLFIGNVVAKLVLDVIGVAAGGTTSGAEKSLLLSAGLTLVGEALVLLVRSGVVDVKDLAAQTRRSSPTFGASTTESHGPAAETSSIATRTEERMARRRDRRQRG